MYLLVAGVRHRTASIEIREKVAFSETEIRESLPRLLEYEAIEECAILNTCNRTEFYVATHDTRKAIQSIKRFLAHDKRFQWEDHLEAVFLWLHDDAILHLFRVAAGLDSLILGEGQIQAQVKEAFQNASRAKTTGMTLDRLFKTALSVGKLVRTETGIDKRDLSISQAAYDFAIDTIPDLLSRPIAIVGGGAMAELLLGIFQESLPLEQRQSITIVNRSEQRLRYLMGKYGCPGTGWDGIESVIDQAEIIFVATGAPHVVLGLDDFVGTSSKMVIDIAVPRNVDPAVGELEHIQLHNTDDLAGYGGFRGDSHEFILKHAESIIYEEFAQFQQWLVGLKVQPTIKQLRAKIESIRQAEASACHSPQDEETLALLELFSKSLINKILHEPTVRLKQANGTADALVKNAETLRFLFAIDEEAPLAHTIQANPTAAPPSVEPFTPRQSQAQSQPEMSEMDRAALEGCPEAIRRQQS